MSEHELAFALGPYRFLPSISINGVVGDLPDIDSPTLPLPVNVIFHDPATIVYWDDGTKTVVKCQPGDVFSAETGLTTAMLKKYMGNDNTFNRVINEWLKHTKR